MREDVSWQYVGAAAKNRWLSKNSSLVCCCCTVLCLNLQRFCQPAHCCRGFLCSSLQNSAETIAGLVEFQNKFLHWQLRKITNTCIDSERYKKHPMHCWWATLLTFCWFWCSECWKIRYHQENVTWWRYKDQNIIEWRESKWWQHVGVFGSYIYHQVENAWNLKKKDLKHT